MSKKPKNGPVKNYKFISEYHKKQFDNGLLSFKEATVEVKLPYHQPLTQQWLKDHTKNVKNYVYANYLHAEATKFMVFNQMGVAVLESPYMQLDTLWMYMTDTLRYTVYISNL
jgi:hypothetical protein